MKKVTAAIILKEDKVLIMRRAPGQKYAGGWEFPGGKIEEGETLEHCLERELKEELNIVASVQRFFYKSNYNYPQGNIQLFAYIVKIIAGDIQLSVHDKLEWVDKENLLSFDLLPADVPIAKKIVEEISMSFKPSFSIGDTVTNEDIRLAFQCGNMGGMRRSHKTNTLVIISDHTKGLYEDKWFGDELHYTGMGKSGDQSLDFMQNKTLAQSNYNGVEVHLFEALLPLQYIYRGQVSLCGDPYQEKQLGEDGINREVWMFPLKLKTFF
jgi:5-methylcytosine-specific restriction protein A